MAASFCNCDRTQTNKKMQSNKLRRSVGSALRMRKTKKKHKANNTENTDSIQDLALFELELMFPCLKNGQNKNKITRKDI